MSDTPHTVCIEFCGGPFDGFCQLIELQVGDRTESRLWRDDKRSYHHYESDDAFDGCQVILHVKYRGVVLE